MTDDAVPGDETSVSTVELFFDLVFVFAITQITWLVNHDATARGLGHAVVVFAMLWWAWGAYAWLTNTLPTGEMAPRLLLLGGMGAALVAALAVPDSFAGTGTAFGLAYLVVMVIHLALFMAAAENPAVTRQAIMRLAPTNLLGAALLIAGGLAGNGGHDGNATQELLWTAAVLASYAGPYVTGVAGFTVHPRHFAERHGLIVIIALGESVVAIGAGARGLPVDWALAGTTLLAVALVTALWWAYFDGDAAHTERAMTAATGVARARLARDAYSYLHVPLVFGIVLTAVGLHEAVLHPGDALDPVVSAAFGGGVALYVGGLTAKRLRCGARPGLGHLATVAWAVAVAAVASEVDAVVALGMLALPAVAVAVADTWVWAVPPPGAEARSDTRPGSA
jgi:low temperature requirement protein LtrA